MAKPEAKHWLLTINHGTCWQDPDLPDPPDLKDLKDRLRRLGAAAAGGSAYLIPKDPSRSSDLLRLLSDINRRGGRASLSSTFFSNSSSMVNGGSVQAPPLFPEASMPLIAEPSVAASPDAAFRTIRSLMERAGRKTEPRRNAVQKVEGNVWVTAKGVLSGTSAAAWLIWRFIDPGAVFKFVTPEGYRTAAGEMSFGMPGADFEGRGGKTTFEVLTETFNLQSRSFHAMGLFLRTPVTGDPGSSPSAEARKLKALLFGVIMVHGEDLHRFRRSFPILDTLYTLFQSAPANSP